MKKAFVIGSLLVVLMLSLGGSVASKSTDNSPTYEQLRLFTEVLDGRNAHLADGVQRALGRQPRDFRDYARDAAATGVWNTSAVSA